MRHDFVFLKAQNKMFVDAVFMCGVDWWMGLFWACFCSLFVIPITIGFKSIQQSPTSLPTLARAGHS